MSDQTPNAGAAEGTEPQEMPSGRPAEEPVITINGEQVRASDAQSKLQEMERSIKSGYDKKLSEEREQIQANLNKDKQWYATHPVEAWEYYKPLVDGGEGFIGDEALLKRLEESNMDDDRDNMDTREEGNNKDKNAFNESPDIMELKNKIAQLEKITGQVYENVNQSEITRVAQARDGIMQKYPNANKKLINLELERIYTNTGKHASNSTIEKLVQESHKEITNMISNATKGTEETGAPTKKVSATPDAGGTPPSGKEEKIPSMESNYDGFLQHIKSKITQG